MRFREDGLIYTFKLRAGVKFHNGREMTAEDVKYSLDRVTNPATQSPGAGFFGAIAGFDAAGDGGLSGVKVVDPLTVEITLSRPDATFLHVMALNFASVVPKEAVDAAGDDFGKQPVGTGAFKLAEWTMGQRLVFEKNADYWRAGVPYLDSVVFEVGQEPIVALLRLQNGEVDVPGDGIPPAKFQEVMGDPAQAERVVEGGQLHTGYITLNVTMPPFDKVEVRKAINMAINKDRIIQIINGRAVPATQPLPPSMPGYTEGYAGYPYDVEGAKALLAEAGLADGFETELYVMNTDPNPRIAQAIQQDLAAIGITANIQTLAQANVIEAGGAGTAPMIWSGGMAWIADFPDPSNFYGPILGCAGAVEGGWNWSKFCDEALDAKAVAADSTFDPANGCRPAEDVVRRLHGRDGAGALGAGLQRRALHDEVGTHGRRGCALRRSGVDPGQLRLRLGETSNVQGLRLHDPRRAAPFRLGQLPAPGAARRAGLDHPVPLS